MDSATTTVCPWKGQAHYYTVRVEGETEGEASGVLDRLRGLR